MRRRRGCLHAMIVLLMVAVFLVGFWYFQNYVIHAEDVALPSNRLPQAFDGLRVAEIADLHGRQLGPAHEDLLVALRAGKPDIIAINGDLADENTDLAVIASLAPQLVEIAPTYYVTGNHEWVMDDLEGLFACLIQAGVTVLRNDYRVLERDGQSIVIAGVDDPNGPYDQKSPEQLTQEIRAAHGDVYILMLAHRNDQLELWSKLEVDAVLTGHGHGGVIRLPFVGGLVGVHRELFPSFSAGVYPDGRTQMFVSRGLGNSSVNFRLFNRPHLPVLVLRTAAATQ